MIKKYLVYLFRWQLSTPVLVACLLFIPIDSDIMKTVLANLVGGLIFFWVDRAIFSARGSK